MQEFLRLNEEATREGRPKPTAFTDEEISSIVPVDPTVEDYETEEHEGPTLSSRRFESGRC